MQRGREPPGDSALDLTFEAGEVDHLAAIHEAGDTVDAKIAEVTGDGHVGDFRDVALAEVRVQGDAAPPVPIAGPGRRLGPAGCLPGELQNPDHATAIDALIAESQDIARIQELDAQVQR